MGNHASGNQRNPLNPAENPPKRIPYGAYDSSNAKLITADSEYPKNYEHYSNFEPKKNPRNTERNPRKYSREFASWINRYRKYSISSVCSRYGIQLFKLFKLRIFWISTARRGQLGSRP